MADSSIPAAGSPLPSDPILPSLQRIRDAYDQHLDNPNRKGGGNILKNLTATCIDKFSKVPRYRSDERLLKITIILADVSGKFQEAFAKLEKYNICQDRALLYESQALFYIREGNLLQAYNLYNTGFERKAEPCDRLMKLHEKFLDLVLKIAMRKLKPVALSSLKRTRKVGVEVNPYSSDLIWGFYKQIKWKELQGFNALVGKNVPDISVNAVIQLGAKYYRIDRYLGKGTFASVFRAHTEGNPDDVYALKVEERGGNMGRWEFYMYRVLDKRILRDERSRFGFAHELHCFRNSSIMLCDYLPLGSLVDIVNSYLMYERQIPELVCMYFAIEMLDLLDILHNENILHGDFKADNILVRYASDELTEEGFVYKTGPWRDQGLCLIDWGKGIDLDLFAYETAFIGDCGTKNFSCCEMLDKKPWMYQIDTFALCQNVYMMLHDGKPMRAHKVIVLEKREFQYEARPLRSNWDGYWHLWPEFFTSLLSIETTDQLVVQDWKDKIQDYISSDPQKLKELIGLLAEGRQFLTEWMHDERRNESSSDDYTSDSDEDPEEDSD